MTAKSGDPITPLHALKHGQAGDVFLLLSEKVRATTRDDKPYYSCRFRDAKRTVSAKIWSDSHHFDDCQKNWHPGMCYKARILFTDHERFGAQIEIFTIREVRREDEADGYRESDMYDGSRYSSEVMFGELRTIAETELSDIPLRTLTLTLLDSNAPTLKILPAGRKRFYTFAGGWLEHTLSVTRSCLFLVDKYGKQYPELSPPLNRNLLIAGAILQNMGRLLELSPGPPGAPAEPTLAGSLIGSVALGRDLIRETARQIPELNPELLVLLEHLLICHHTAAEWGAIRPAAIPEAIILQHACDLDAKMEMVARKLHTDDSDGLFTGSDGALKKSLLKRREV